MLPKQPAGQPAHRRLTAHEGGETAGAEALFHTHAARIYNLAGRMLGNANDAEGVTLEVLLEATGNPEVYPGHPWPLRATVRSVLAYRRARRRAGDGAVPAKADEPARCFWSGTPLEAALATLPDACRDVLVLADVEGLGTRDVGSLLELTPLEVKALLHCARLLVRGAFQPDDRDEQEGAERRAFPRHRVGRSCHALIRRVKDRLAWAAFPEDISPGGIRILARQPHHVGRILELEPGSPQLLGGRRFTFRLIRCEPSGDGYHLAGSFLTPLAEADLVALVVPWGARLAADD